jgi:hypothetical protein
VLPLLLACAPTVESEPVDVAADTGETGRSFEAACDWDADGFYADEAVCRGFGERWDCDDTDAAVHPDAREVCGNGRDDDCSGRVDDAGDDDDDGVDACEDCDDADPFVSPDQPEACDGIDNDCSGAADEPWDDDGDGTSDCAGDCDDDDPERAPALAEVCDGVDNDCDGEADEGFDADGDGWLTCRGDCDDASAAAYPGAEETCDGVDNDCDAATVEGTPGAAEVCDGVDNDCDGGVDNAAECWGCTSTGDYLVCTTATSWDEAEAACEAFGRTLAVIGDAPENTRVSGYHAAALWIGYTDAGEEGAWAWADGSAAAFTQWYSGEPNNSGEEDCAATNFGAVGYWNDYPCSYALAFVCE